jgi:FkbM family methyltransferase
VHLVHEYFGNRPAGFFVEVGANEPKRYSQTWHLEQQGWRGVLIEPIPALCQRLRAERPGSTVVQVACSAPERIGTARFNVASNAAHSSLREDDATTGCAVAEVIDVEVTTLDLVLESHCPDVPDFVSIDVEGDQVATLRGFDLARWRPGLVLIEDHLTSYGTHMHMKRAGYRLAKRTGVNSWYIPHDAAFSLTSPAERRALWRKLWLRTVFRAAKAKIRGHV